jgi:hypothetical protein
MASHTTPSSEEEDFGAWFDSLSDESAWQIYQELQSIIAELGCLIDCDATASQGSFDVTPHLSPVHSLN